MNKEQQNKQFIMLVDNAIMVAEERSAIYNAEPVRCTPEDTIVRNYTDYEEFLATLAGYFEAPNWGWVDGSISDGGFQRVGFEAPDGKVVEIQFQPYKN